MIDFSKFEEKTRGGYGWEVIVPEDGLIRAVHEGGSKTYLFVDVEGSCVRSLGDVDAFWMENCALVLREEEWRAGWRPEYSRYYYSVHGGQTLRNSWVNDPVDKYRKMCGNCYPDTPRGKLLAEARAKYEPLIGEIAGMDEPMAVFDWLRWRSASPVLALPPCPPGLGKVRDGWEMDALRAAIRWLDSGYRLTLEEAEA